MGTGERRQLGHSGERLDEQRVRVRAEPLCGLRVRTRGGGAGAPGPVRQTGGRERGVAAHEQADARLEAREHDRLAGRQVPRRTPLAQGLHHL